MDKGISRESFESLKEYLRIQSYLVEPGPDHGSCVMGNGISVLTVPKGLRKARHVMIFRNPWTQAEQESVLRQMISKAIAEFPELAPYIRYECGNMD